MIARIRELCVRVINARGAAFDAATKELADALELWQANQDKDQKDKEKDKEKEDKDKKEDASGH